MKVTRYLVRLLEWGALPLLVLVVGLFSQATHAQFKSFQKISDTQGGFNARLENGDDLGESVTALGDLDQDGTPDMAITAEDDDDGGNNRGAVYILFMKPDGSVRSFQKISQTVGKFSGQLDDEDEFGNWVTTLGDVDGDGITDIAVAAIGDDDGGSNTGAIWIIFLNRDGTAKGQQKISDTQGDFTGALDNDDCFGCSLEGLGDFDNDGIPDLAAGTQRDDDGGSDRGAVWLLMLNSNGTVKNSYKISDTTGGFTGGLDDGDGFGQSMAAIGDFDSDGVNDLAVTAEDDDDGGVNRGSVWLLMMNSDGTVKNEFKISDTAGGFTGGLNDGDQFGQSVESIGDLDGDGVTDIAVGAEFDSDSGQPLGATWLLYLNANGTVKDHFKIDYQTPGFVGQLDRWDEFGQDITNIGDLDGDGVVDIVVTADGDDDGGSHRGAAYVFFLEAGSNGDGGNRPPELGSIGDQGVVEDSLLEFTVTAEDSDGDEITLTTSTLPPGSDFVDNGDGTGDFSWMPAIGASSNSPYAVTFTARDSNGATDQEQISISVTPAAGGDTFQQDAGPRGIVSVEVENFHRNTAQGEHQWVRRSDSEASGGVGMRAEPNNGTNIKTGYVNNSPRLDFDIDFVKAGTHYVWILGFGKNSGEDSAHVGLDGVGVTSAASIKGFDPTGEWVWESSTPSGRAMVVVSSVGAHTLNLWMREDQFFADKIVLTTDPNFVPAGFGPSESSTNGQPPGGGGNRPPELGSIGDQGAVEDSLLEFTVTAEDSDGDEITLTTSTLPPGADFVDNGDGTGDFSWMPAIGASSNSPYAVTFTARDSNGATDQEQISISVTPAGGGGNRPPELGSIGDQGAVEDSLLEFTVTAEDSDGDEITLTTSTLPPGSDFVDNGDGTGDFSWMPAIGASSNSPYAVTFTARDSNGATDQEQISISVTPAAGGDTFQQDAGPRGIVSVEVENFHRNTAQGEHQWVRRSDSEASGGVGMRAEPNNGTNIKTGYVNNSPRLDFDIDFVKAGTHYVWILGFGKNAGGDSAHVGLDGVGVASAASIKGFDPTGEWVWESSTPSGRATVVVSSVGTHTLNLWMREDQFFADKIVLTTDPNFVPAGFGPSESSTNGQPPGGGGNRPPELGSIGDQGAVEDSLLEFTVTAEDSDGDEITLTTSTLPPGADFVDNGDGTGDFSWMPAIGASSNSPYAVTFTARDSNGATDQEQISISVTPVAGGDNFQQDAGPRGIVSVEVENFHRNTAQGEHQWVRRSDSEASGGAGMRAEPNNGTNIKTGYVNNSPRLNFDINFVKTGTHYVWILGFGKNAGGDSAHVGLDGVGVASAASIKGFDPTGEWVWESSTPSGRATVVVSSVGTHTLNLWMREDQFFADKIVLTTDPNFIPAGFGPSESSTNGQPPGGGGNRPPELGSIGDQGVVEDSLLEFTVTAEDSDGDEITLTTSTLPPGADFVDNGDGTGDFSWMPAIGASSDSPYAVTFTARDSNGATDQEQISISVTPAGTINNTAPVATGSTVTTDQGTPSDGILTASDADNDPLTFSIVTNGGKGTAIITDAATGDFTYTPSNGQIGADSFTFKANDGNSDSNIAEVTVSINALPSAEDACKTTPQEQALIDNLMASDADNSSNELAFRLDPSSTHSKGSVTVNLDGSFEYTPTPGGQRGKDVFSFLVEDPNGASDQGSVTVIVNPKIMPLGDSITAGVTTSGQPAADLRVGYRKPLYDSLVSAGFEFDFVGESIDFNGTDEPFGAGVSPFDPDSEAYGGSEALEIANGPAPNNPNYNGVFAALDDNPADIVLLHIGTNDGPVPGTTESHVETILDGIDDWENSAGGNPVTVVLALIINRKTPIQAVTNFNINMRDSVVPTRIANGDDIIVVDMESALGPNDMADNIHPNDTPNGGGYKLMADQWFETLTVNGPSILEMCP